MILYNNLEILFSHLHYNDLHSYKVKDISWKMLMMANTRPGINHLQTQQCRLRHLRSLCARNVVVIPAPHEMSSDVASKLGYYFTLHVDESSEAFYASEVIYDITNLNWKSFNWTRQSETTNLSLASIVIKLCAKSENTCLDNNEVIFSRFVTFKKLHCIGEQIPKDGQHFPPNTLVCEMLEGFYAEQVSLRPKNLTNVKENCSKQKIHIKPSEAVVDATALRNSYDLSTLKRVHTVQRAIKQTRASVLRVRNVIHDKLAATETTLTKCVERECIVSRLNLLRDEFEHQKQSLRQIQKQCQESKQKNDQKALDLVRCGLSLKKNEDMLIEHRRNLIDARENLVKTLALLAFRRRQLLTELAIIYPIDQIDKKFTICGVHLPNSEDFTGCDDTMISVALGYVCHLITMIAHFLHVPTRYPLIHLGTRSKIYDYFISTISDSEREFPLYSRGKDKLQFKYGVYLLNKNIAQLRFYCGLTTADLRLTLPNLKALLDLQLRIANRIELSSSAPVDIDKKPSGSNTKQVLQLSEDPNGSTDSLNLDGTRHHQTQLFRQSPDGCRSGHLSLSLDHGLDEMVQDPSIRRLRSSTYKEDVGYSKNLLINSRTSAELHLSEPSLIDVGLNYNGVDEPKENENTDVQSVKTAIRTSLPPFQIYTSESEPEELPALNSEKAAIGFD